MKAGWVQLPIEQAPPWLRLGAVARALGAELFRVWQERTIEGVRLSDFEDVAVRMLAPDPRERKAIRVALKTIVEAGLVVESEGGVRLLYGRASYADHRRMVDASSTHGARKVDVRSTHGRQMVPPKPAEPLDPPSYIEREKEREKEQNAGAREYPELPKPLEDNPEVPLPEKPYSLRGEYVQRFTAATRLPYVPVGTEHRAWDDLIERFTQTVAMRAADPRELGGRFWTAVFADTYMQENRFPVRLVCSQFAKFVDPPAPREDEEARLLREKREREARISERARKSLASVVVEVDANGNRLEIPEGAFAMGGSRGR